jgi:polyhydroxybutyrate depolymerase
MLKPYTIAVFASLCLPLVCAFSAAQDRSVATQQVTVPLSKISSAVTDSTAPSGTTAPTSTLTQYTTTWDGLQRIYYVYAPTAMAKTPSIVVFLHASYLKPAVPLYEAPPWEALAQRYGFILLLPISTWDPSISTWRWDCDGCESGFKNPPDDSGFIRSTILTVQTEYGIEPGQTFVGGMSSGAYMAQRIGMEQSDIIAAIAPVSGAQYIQPLGNTFTPPLVPNPISVYRLQGDSDTAVPYCGGVKGFWNRVKAYSPSMDQDEDFWSGPLANSCTTVSESQEMCTNGEPTPGVNGQDATGCTGGVEVLFEREVGVGHEWVPGTEAKLWAFFQTHGR